MENETTTTAMRETVCCSCLLKFRRCLCLFCLATSSPRERAEVRRREGRRAQMSNYYSRSPPPLQHPVPTHPAFIPEPPSTPTSPPQGYQRYHPQTEPNIPDFGAWGLNDATTQFGMQLGQSAVAAGQDYVQKNVRIAELPGSFALIQPSSSADSSL